MTNRSGFNKAIDAPLLKDVPTYIATDLVDNKRNTIIKMGSNSKYLNRKKESIVSVETKKDKEAKYFFNKFNGIFSP
jgi:hypothetical protein